MEGNRIFKAYLRLLYRDLKALKAALKAKDFVEAERLLDGLVEDTQQGIED